MSLSSILVMLCLLAAGAYVAVRNWRGHPARRTDAWRMETLSQLPFGPRERLVIVRVTGRVLLLGVTPQQVTLVRELDPDAPGDAAGVPAADTPVTGGFAALLRNAASHRSGAAT